MVTDKINQFILAQNTTVDQAILDTISDLTSHYFLRQFVSDSKPSRDIRVSNAGKCPRSLAYQWHEFPVAGKELDARAKLVFWYGDMTEMVITQLARAAGVNILYTGKDQKEVSLRITDGYEMKGHPDGVIDDTLFECKSMTSFGFKRFEQGELDLAYLVQINLYMYALNLTKCVVVAFNKEACVIDERLFSLNRQLVEATLDRLRGVLASTKDKLPDRWYGPGKDNYLPWQCGFCRHWKTCQTNAEQVVVSGRYKLRVKK